MSKINKTIIWGVVIIIVVFVVYLGVKNRTRQESSVVKIGVAVAKTGDASQWGEVELNVYSLVINDLNENGGINGKPIRLIVEDTKSTNVGTINAVSKLINIDHVPVILGPTWADTYQSANSVAEKAHVVLLSPSAAIEVVKANSNLSYFFSTWWSIAPETSALEKFMQGRQIKNIDVVNDEDPWGSKVADIFMQNAPVFDIKISSSQKVSIGTEDFRTVISKIKDDGINNIFLQVNSALEEGIFMKQLHELGVNKTVFSTSQTQDQSLVNKFGNIINGIIYSYPHSNNNQIYQQLVADYQNTYNATPTSPSFTNAYNAIQALIWVLKQGATSGSEIKNLLHEVNVPGAGIETISFDSNGSISNTSFEIRTIKNGQFITLEQ